MRPKTECGSFETGSDRPRVYVYGGGVAGMTAAHELAIRGFAVHLYERERALGARGVLEEQTLGGMARTQYFATTPQQRLYFHVDTVKRLLQRLVHQCREELLEALKRGRSEERLSRFLESFWELQMRLPDEASRSLLHVLAKALGEQPLRSLVETLRHMLGSMEELHQPDTMLPSEPFTLDGLVEHTQRRLSALPAAASQGVVQRLAPRFAQTLLQMEGGALAIEFLKGLAAHAESAGLLPAPLRQPFERLLKELLPHIDPLSFFYASLLAELSPDKSAPFISPLVRTVRGQGPESGSYFPEFWVEFLREGNAAPRMTEDSERGLKIVIEYVNQLVDAKYFDTELGIPSDVRVLVQAFEDPGLSELRGLAGGISDMSRESQMQAQSLADIVKDRLKREADGLKPPLNGVVRDYSEVARGPLKAYSALGLAPVTRDWVRVIFYRTQLPGEHGYRFFPSYYRHVFDTMRSIPLQGGDGQPTGGTVLDNLVPLPEIGIFSKRGAPFVMSWNPLQMGEVLARSDYSRRNLASLNIHSRDLLQFALRVLRYMTSCSRRRAAEMEDVSWWDYLEGYDARTRTRLYRYSDSFKHMVRSSSRVLAALDGAQGDARTCGNTYVQLLTELLVPTSQNNCTLNGPTSEAWFQHWRGHLVQLGVTFHHGELRNLHLKGDRLVAHVRRFPKMPMDKREEPHGETEKVPVYFVVATDLASAARVSKDLNLKMARQLQDYAFQAPKRGGAGRVRRNPEKVSGRSERDRLQTISGIQYFFKKHVNIFDGYLYCVDAEWGLSAICSHVVWQDRPVAALSAYQSILSVDIGDWETKSRNLKKPARRCTPEELAKEVLHQLQVSLSARGKERGSAGFTLPKPDWIHIDESLEYESLGNDPSKSRLRRNKAPYLVPIVGDWKNRPGPEPWDPSPEAERPPRWAHGKASWQAPHGGYPVHYGRLVFAGTWPRTFTRMTTMESANESARHAVNAILDHYSTHHLPADQRPKRSRPPKESELEPMTSNPYAKGFFPTTPQGDYCRIWNPETHELPDFELFQHQDDENFRQSRPHPLDALGMEVLPSLLSPLSGGESTYESLIKGVASYGAGCSQVPNVALLLLRHLRTLLESARPPRGY